MRHLLILLLPAALSAQDLPLAWPDQPGGTVLFVAHPTLFTGSLAVASDGRWIHAWSDMRDGNGRVFAQKSDPDHPADSGAWHSVIPGWGPVGGLSGPAAALTPVLPQLASDMDGGAFLLWQDMDGGETGDLLLRRVGDGPDGQGAFQWDEDLLLAEDMPLPFEDCRDDRERCRSWMDSWRQIVPDGMGGVWVAWRMQDGTLRLQHVEADGTRDPDLPAAGLALPVTSWGFQLAATTAGALVFHREEVEPGRLAVVGAGLDGGWLVPEISRVLSSGRVNEFAVSGGPDGDMRVAWSSDVDWRVQRLGSDLSPLWPADGLLLASGTYWGVRTAGRAEDGLLAVAGYDATGQWLLQLLDEAGHVRWAQPVALDLVDNGQPGELRALALDETGPAYVMQEGDGLHLQRVEPDGHLRWPLETTQLGTPATPVSLWRLQPDTDGRLRVGLFEYGIEDNLQVARTRLACRDLDGAELVDAPQSLLLEEVWGTCQGSHLLQEGEDPQLATRTGNTLFTQRVEGHSGRRSWAFHERPVLTAPYLEVQTLAPSPLGTWILADQIGDDSGRTSLQASRLDLEGNVDLPTIPLAPAVLADPNYFSQFEPLAAPVGTNLVAGWEHWAGSLLQVRLQRLDALGNRLWGDDGLAVPPAGILSSELLGLAAFGNGTVGVLWSERSQSQNIVCLQAFHLDGSRVFSDNGGRGLHLNLDFTGWSGEGHAQSLPDGSLLVAVRDMTAEGLDRWRLARVEADGQIGWRHTEASTFLTSPRVWVGEQGKLWLGRTRMDADRLRFHLERRTVEGGLERTWTVDVPDGWYGQDWALTQADGESAVALLDWNGTAFQWHIRALRLPEGDAQPFVDAPAPMVGHAWNLWLREAPQGDVWLVWNDERGANLGYGSQIRLTRLDLLHLNTPVEAPNRVGGFHLEAARPNPFNPTTTLAFTLERAAATRLDVFNLAGQRVRTVWDGPLAAGRHELRFDGRDDAGRELGSGVYLHRLEVEGRRESGRMLLLR